MRVNLKLLLAASASIVAIKAVVFAQVGPQMRVLKTPSGITLICEPPADNFRMQITGQNVSRVRTPKRYWFETDGVRFEFFSEENSRFVMTDVPIVLPDRTVLELYKSEFIRSRSSEDPKISASWVTLANRKHALLWTATSWPASPAPVAEKEMYIVLAMPTRVYALFAPIKDGQSETDVRRVLTRTLGSLTFSDAPVATPNFIS